MEEEVEEIYKQMLSKIRDSGKLTEEVLLTMNYILQESFEGALDIIDNKRSIKVKSIPSNRSFYLFDIKLIPQSLPAPPPPSSSLPPPPSSSSSSSSSSSPSSSPSSNANVNSNSSSTSSSNSSSSLPPFDPANPLIPSICPIKFEVLSAQSTNQSGGNGGPSSSSSSSSSSSMNGLIFAFDHYCSCFSFKHFPSSLILTRRGEQCKHMVAVGVGEALYHGMKQHNDQPLPIFEEKLISDLHYSSLLLGPLRL